MPPVKHTRFAADVEYQQQDNDVLDSHMNALEHTLAAVSAKTGIPKFQLCVLATYPVVLIFGQLLAWVSPEQMASNYFTSKGNLFNKVFVKQGWVWTSLVFFLLLADVICDRTKKAGRARLLLTGLKKYAVVTLCWFLFSQWCFGFPLMDKIFLLTGGSCYNIPESNVSDEDDLFRIMDFEVNGLDTLETGYWSNQVSSKQCRRLRGNWYGGHDPSGHVFLLTLSSSFLLEELFTFYTPEELVAKFRQLRHQVQIHWAHKEYLGVAKELFVSNGWVFLVGLVALWYWMLLMTSLFFHSVLEKIGGLMFSYLVTLVSERV